MFKRYFFRDRCIYISCLLQFEEEAQFLGITIDSNLTWDKHCNNVANKISRNSGVLNWVKKILPTSSLKILYSSFIQPHIQYCLPVWGGCNGQNKKRIVAIQKRAIRNITKSYFSSHTEPRMKKIGILKFEDLYKQQCLMLTYDIVHKDAPKVINESLNLEQNVSKYTLRNHDQNPLDLRAPLSKTRAGTNSFSFKAPKIWNEIPNEIKHSEKRHIFKRATKKLFLDQYHHKMECKNPRCPDKKHHN